MYQPSHNLKIGVIILSLLPILTKQQQSFVRKLYVRYTNEKITFYIAVIDVF